MQSGAHSSYKRLWTLDLGPEKGEELLVCLSTNVPAVSSSSSASSSDDESTRSMISLEFLSSLMLKHPYIRKNKF